MPAFLRCCPPAVLLLLVAALVLPSAHGQIAATADPALQPLAEFHMARMIYRDGGARGRGRYGLRRGWWAIDYPEAELHFYGG